MGTNQHVDAGIWGLVVRSEEENSHDGGQTYPKPHYREAVAPFVRIEASPETRNLKSHQFVSCFRSMPPPLPRHTKAELYEEKGRRRGFGCGKIKRTGRREAAAQNNIAKPITAQDACRGRKAAK